MPAKTYSERAAALRKRCMQEVGAQLAYDIYVGLLRVRLHTGSKIKLQPYTELAYTQRRHFQQAAASAATVEAPLRLYIAAQFAAFERYSKGRKRLIPQPSQLFGIAAQTRYLEAAGTQAEAQERTKLLRKSQHHAFFREERKLKAWCASKSMSPQEVLLAYSEEFTSEFLEHKGVSECL